VNRNSSECKRKKGYLWHSGSLLKIDNRNRMTLIHSIDIHHYIYQSEVLVLFYLKFFKEILLINFK